jgi:SAM-dependent methyltransferase
MLILSKFNGDFYDEDYYQRGKQSGKGWLENYKFMPKRSFREALAFIDYMKIPDDARILDLGCAYGFLVRAFRELEYNADGCDISSHALSRAPERCWNCSNPQSWLDHFHQYTHVVCKDVLEHLDLDDLEEMMYNIGLVTNKFMCVVPMGDKGKYRIPEYHLEISHQIAEDEDWWSYQFMNNGWKIIKETNHVPGLKDNWAYCETGNHVFVLEKNV